nr:uncharacterized protein LOC109731227 isoform X1 [Microcebus murinus]
MSSVHVHGHTGLAPTSEPFGSHARRSSPSLCAGALAAPNPPRIGSAPPRALTVTRPAGGAALRARGAPRAPAGPYLSGGLCRGAAPVHGARRPASEARSPPRRGDSGRNWERAGVAGPPVAAGKARGDGRAVGARGAFRLEAQQQPVWRLRWQGSVPTASLQDGGKTIQQLRHTLRKAP